MPREVEFDFTNTPAAQGGGLVHIPPANYGVKVATIEDGRTNDQSKRKVSVTLEIVQGTYTGTILSDNFSWAAPGDFGLKRFHAFLLALGIPIQQRKIQFDIDKLVGKTCIVKVIDNELKATDQYDAKTVSRPDIYMTTQGVRPDQPQTNGAVPQQQAPQAPQQMMAPPPPQQALPPQQYAPVPPQPVYAPAPPAPAYAPQPEQQVVYAPPAPTYDPMTQQPPQPQYAPPPPGYAPPPPMGAPVADAAAAVNVLFD